MDRDEVVIVGLVTALAAITAATPQMIIRNLNGVLWNDVERDRLLKVAEGQTPLFDGIINGLIAKPSPTHER